MPTKKEHIIDFGSTDFKAHIVNNIIKPNYLEEIQDFTNNRNVWRKRAMRLETCSKLFIGVGGIISFSSGFYGYPTLSFISGAISTISLVLLQYANFSYKESKKATSDLNILLDNIGIKKIPELNTTTQDNEVMMNSKQSVKPSSPEPYTQTYGSGYTVKSPSVKEEYKVYDNPLSYSETEEYKQRIKYEDYCNLKKFDEIKKMHEEENFKITDLVLQQTANSNNLIMFTYFISKIQDITCYDTLFWVAKAGLDFTQEYFKGERKWEFVLKKGQRSPLLGAVLSGDINNVKLVFEKCGGVWMIDSCEELRQAHKLNNEEIIKFCIENGALQKDDRGHYNI
jgi:hypothetical protein